MEQSNSEILVTGATGRQGGAVVRHLLRRGHRLRALCRDPGSGAARALASAGVRVFRGDLDERGTLDRAVAGVHGVFGIQDFWDGFPPGKLGPEREARQGKNLMDAAKAAGVAHFVQASGAAVTIAPELAVNRGKLEVEEYGRAIGLPLTVLRVAFSMDNFDDPTMGFGDPVRQGRLEMPFDADRPLQMIAMDDVGQLVAMAFERPADFVGQQFDAAGDELTMTGIAETFARVMGRPVRFTGGAAVLAQVRAYDRDLGDLFGCVNEHGFRAFLPGLRALHPGMLTFEQYLRQTGWGTRAAA